MPHSQGPSDRKRKNTHRTEYKKAKKQKVRDSSITSANDREDNAANNTFVEIGTETHASTSSVNNTRRDMTEWEREILGYYNDQVNVQRSWTISYCVMCSRRIWDAKSHLCPECVQCRQKQVVGPYTGLHEIIGDVPDALSGLSDLEVLLISKFTTNSYKIGMESRQSNGSSST
jgi:hypothetical protein